MRCNLKNEAKWKRRNRWSTSRRRKDSRRRRATSTSGANFEIVQGGKVQAVDQSQSIPEKYLENITARGIKDPNAGCPDDPKYRTVVDFIISGSHERLTQLAFGRQAVDLSPGASNKGLNRRKEIERWACDMYDTLAGRFGEENILSFVVHLDERTPHIHADVIPVTPDGKLALHDLFAAVNARWGLQRGDSVALTHAKKKSHEEYRRELSGECSTLEREVDSKSATLKTLDEQIAQAARRLKGLTTMVSNLEAARERIESEIDAIRASLSEDGLGTERVSALRQQEESLQKKLGDILSRLEDKRGKLRDAERKLSDLRRQIASSEDRQEELQKQIRDATSQVSEIALNKVGIQALWTVLRDFQLFKGMLPREESTLLDDSLLQDMSRQGVNIITCAALLFVGMVDQATTFAENKGGGGGHSHGGWGRDPEEDERAWILRCLARSRQMFSPQGRSRRI